MNRPRRFLLAASLLQAAAGPATVSVHGAWARATAPGQRQAAIYMSLTSPTGDTLLGVSSPLAAHAMLHQSSGAGGVARMTDMDSLPLPAGQSVRLEPRGRHVMLDGLTPALSPGGQVTLTLRFAHAPPATVHAPVLPIGSVGP